MSLIVKICGLQTPADVDTAVQAGADAIGFVFYPKSVRYVTIQQACEAALIAPSHVRRVAVMHHPSNTEWQAVLHEFTPDVLQTDIEDFDTLDVPSVVQRWPVLREHRETIELPGTFLYEGAKSGQGKVVDWTRASKLARGGKMILAGGLTPDNVAAAIDAVRPAGVDASTGLESAPGEKDATLITRFVAAARSAEKRQ